MTELADGDREELEAAREAVAKYLREIRGTPVPIETEPATVYRP